MDKLTYYLWNFSNPITLVSYLWNFFNKGYISKEIDLAEINRMGITPYDVSRMGKRRMGWFSSFGGYIRRMFSFW